MRRALVAVALLAAAPVALPMSFLLWGDLQMLTDPCHEWGMGNPSSQTIPADGACSRGVSGTSQTRGAYLLTTLWVKGGAALGLALAVVGTLRERPGLVVAGAWVLFVLSIPLMLGFSGYFVLFSAALFLVALRELPPPSPAALWGARAMAAIVAAGWVFQLVGAGFSGIRAFVLFTVVAGAVPAIMVAATWWPRATRA